MATARQTETRTCTSCGRTMTWRKAWERNWDQVRYCSDACRRRGVTAVDRDLEAAILSLLDARGRGTTICPSQAARQVADRRGIADEWRALMEPARRAARRLVTAGEVAITQADRPQLFEEYARWAAALCDARGLGPQHCRDTSTSSPRSSTNSSDRTQASSLGP